MDLQDDKVLRLTVFRDQNRGLLRLGPISVTDLSVHVNYSALDPTRYQEKNIKLRTAPAPERPHWWPSFLKAGNYLDTILRQKMYLQPGDDDLLFLSSSDTILESSVANLFVVRHNKLYTPPLGPNVLDGVMRKKVISVAGNFFDEINEVETTMEQLYKADAVFGTNSIRGIFLIDRIDGHELNCPEDFLKKFNLMKASVFI